MTGDRDLDLAALYPDGRVYYDEGDDLDAFIAACHGLGLIVAVHRTPPGHELADWTTVFVPADKLAAFNALGLTVGT